MSTNPVINLVDQQPDWPSFAGAPGQAIRKIVLGRTPGESGEDKKPLTINSLPPNCGTLFPHLTHLYLWGIQALSALPELPPKLECLDVTHSGPDVPAPSVVRLIGNVRQPNHVRGNEIAGHKTERRPRAGEEWLSVPEYDGVEVKSILINQTKVG